MPAGAARTLMDLEDGGVERLAIACEKCNRTGNYALSRLVAEHGAGMRLPDLLKYLSRNCPKRSSPGLDQCGAVFRFNAD